MTTIKDMATIRLRSDRRLRKANNGEFLVGGSPATLLRLTNAGAARVRSWFGGAPVTASESNIALAARLANAGMAHVEVELERASDPRRYVVVIPVYNDRDGLRATLSAVGDQQRVIVVDNGSDEPVADLSDLVGRDLVEVVRTDEPTGPAAARNAGLRHLSDYLEGEFTTLDAVAFIDAGVEIAGSDLDVLVAQLDDPVSAPVLAVAPRVRSAPRAGAVGAYERHNSPLDLGEDGGLVGPGRPISYVPTACFVVSQAGLDAGRLNGDLFDTNLRFGEDVDYVWRTADAGTIRYVPTIEATHPPRATLAAFVRQRVGYGSAAGPLGERHGEHVTPFRTSPWSAVVCLAAFSGHGLLGIAAVGVSTELVRRRLPDDLEDRARHALRLVGAGHYRSVLALGAAAVRPWWPFTLLLATRAPHAALRLLGVAALRRLVGSRHGNLSMLKPSQLGLGLLDDVSYGLGVWRGCAATRSFRALLPTISGSFRGQ